MTKRYVLIDDADEAGSAVDLELGPTYLPSAPIPPSAANAKLPIALRGKDSVTWKAVISQGLYGPVYASTTISGIRISRKTRTLRRKNSDDITSDAGFACVEAITTADLITLDGIDRPVLDVARVPDGSGAARFNEVFL